MLKKNLGIERRIDMNIVLCDDNPTFLKLFHQKIQINAAKYNWICEYQLYRNAHQLLGADLSTADILFLDIDMPGIDGITAGRELRGRYPDLIIVYLTGYVQYARDGYSVAAFRYLLKDSLDEELPDCLRDIQQKLYAQQKSIVIRGLEYIRPTRLQDILYFEGTSQRHVIIHTRQWDAECLGKLSDYETELQGQGFLRIQRSFLVNMFHIELIKNYHVQLSNGKELKVSERRYGSITSQYLIWRGRHS